MSRKVMLFATAALLVAILSVRHVHRKMQCMSMSGDDATEEQEQTGTSLAVGLEPIFTPGMGPNDWPQFLGPGGLGQTSANVPVEWSETQNVAWKTPLPGQGHSSPVVKDGKIWLTTAEGEATSLRVLCIDARDGKILRNIEVFRPDQPGKMHAKNTYATPTPVIYGDRLFVHFGALGTACLSIQSGEVLWRNGELKIHHPGGPSSSPVFCDGVLVIPFDGADTQFLAGLDCDSGRVRWKVPRQRAEKGSAIVTAYSTPLALRVNGQAQIITSAVDRASAHDPRTGKELWSVEYRGFSNVPRPLPGDGKVFLCTGYGKPQLWAVVPGTGDVTATHVAWKAGRHIPTVASPVRSGSEIFLLTEQGIISCLDAETGTTHWSERLGSGFSASPLIANGRVFCFDEKGKALVVEASSRYRLLHSNRLDAGCMATPAATDNALIVRTLTHLYRIEYPGSAQVRP